jgi:hypothetical protein
MWPARRRSKKGSLPDFVQITGYRFHQSCRIFINYDFGEGHFTMPHGSIENTKVAEAAAHRNGGAADDKPGNGDQQEV